MAETVVQPVETAIQDAFEHPALQRVPKYLGSLQLRQENITSIINPISHELSTDSLDTSNGATVSENSFVTNALSHVNTFFQVKAQQTQEKLNIVQQKINRTRWGKMSARILVSAAGISVGAPVAQVATEKVHSANVNIVTPEAKAEEVLQVGAESYPWREIRNTGQGCAQYAKWKLLQVGIPEDRTSAMDVILASKQFELVDDIPAPGSLGSMVHKSNGEPHYIYVESVEGNIITFSDYNGWGGPDEFSITRISLEELKAEEDNLQFIHFERPPVANGDFMGTGPDTEKSNAISVQNNTLYEDKYITSPNGQNILLFNTGNLATYNAQDKNNITKTWQSGTSSEGGNQSVQIEYQGKTKNSLLTIENEDGDTIWKIKLGVGIDKITPNDNFTFSAYKGKKKVATAKDIPGLAKRIQVLDRRAAKIARHKRALAAKARKARSAKQNRATTRSKAANKKAAGVTKKRP